LKTNNAIPLTEPDFNQLAACDYEQYLMLVHRGKWLRSRHLKKVCQAMEQVELGELRRVMIFMPPRHGKSRSVSESFPSWFIGRNPDRRVIVVSYAISLARRFGRLNRLKVFEYGGPVFNMQLLQDSKMQADWNVTGHDGGMISAGIEGGITGAGADLMIIDDPIKNREQADSQVFRDKVWDEWESTLKTRLHPGAAVVVILTRWHENDLAGRLLNPEYGPVDDWHIINLPLLAESNDILERQPGEPLWPEHGYDLDWCLRTRGNTSARVFASLYQQRPVPDDGMIWKREWWKYYRRQPMRDVMYVVQSWDTGFKVDDIKKRSSGHSYTAGQTWGQTDIGYYLLDRFLRQVEYPDLKRAVVSEYEKHRPDMILIEDKASGQSLVQDLRRETRLPIVAVPVAQGDKVQRATIASAQAEAGRVFLPVVAPWLNEYMDALESFPNGDNTDDGDATAQALNYFTGKKGRVISGAVVVVASNE